MAPSPYDFMALSSAPLLYAGFDVENGVTLHTTLLANDLNETVPTITISGNLKQMPVPGLRIQIRSEATFDWSLENGCGWAEGFGVRDVTIPNGGSMVLGDSGITAHFAAGTYVSTNNYQATTARVPSFGPVAGCDLDNSSVEASSGLIIERWGMNNRAPSMYRHNAPGPSPGALGNQGALAALVAGANKPFEIWELFAILSTNISTVAVASWSFSNSGNGTDDYLDCVYYGPDVENLTPARAQQTLLRRHAAGADVVIATVTSPHDLSWRVRRIRFDGSDLRVWINGIEALARPVPWTSGSLTPDRFLLGAMKLGSGPVIAQPYQAWNTWLGYSDVLSDSQARELWRALS
jgi:hypothetical protein